MDESHSPTSAPSILLVDLISIAITPWIPWVCSVPSPPHHHVFPCRPNHQLWLSTNPTFAPYQSPTKQMPRNWGDFSLHMCSGLLEGGGDLKPHQMCARGRCCQVVGTQTAVHMWVFLLFFFIKKKKNCSTVLPQVWECCLSVVFQTNMLTQYILEWHDSYSEVCVFSSHSCEFDRLGKPFANCCTFTDLCVKAQPCLRLRKQIRFQRESPSTRHGSWYLVQGGRWSWWEFSYLTYKTILDMEYFTRMKNLNEKNGWIEILPVWDALRL